MFILLKRWAILAICLALCCTAAFADDPSKGSEPEKKEEKAPGVRVIVMPGASPATGEDLVKWREKAYREIIDTYYPISALKGFKKPDKALEKGEDLDAVIAAMANFFNDPYTRYESRAEIFRRTMAGILGKPSLGVELKEEKGLFLVQHVSYTAQLYRHLRRGDQIQSINGKPLKGMSLTQAQEALKAEVGDKVTVGYLGGDGKVGKVEFKMAERVENEVEARMIGSIAYLRIPSFDHGHVAEFAVAVSELFAKDGDKAQGIILDLRGNPGGVFENAVAACSFFMKEGSVAISLQRQRRLETEVLHKVLAPSELMRQEWGKEADAMLNKLQGLPMCVLTNGYTASAAEIVSGALQDSRRALIVGETTFGKDVGFDEIELDNGGRLRIRSLKWLTPTRRDAGRGGLLPDRVVRQPRGDGEDVQLSYVLRHLESLKKSGK